MPEPNFRAIISDMDGVITQTALIHQAAWKQVFDDYLQAQAHAQPQPPFTPEDYRRHVDGKPRLTGIRDFLVSRGLPVLEGDPSDERSVQGLGRRKNEVFLDKLTLMGVQVFDDSLRAFAHWRQQGLKLAVVSASKNCRMVLQRAGLASHFETIVDGVDIEQLKLGDKTGQIREAARRLSVDLADCVLLEDATSGVRAGRRAGVGLIIGVLRDGQPEALQQAGADQVVRDLTQVSLTERAVLTPD